MQRPLPEWDGRELQAPGGPAAADIRAAVQRILASGCLGEKSRVREVLRFIVDETLAGRSARLKAYTIATLVFGRGSEFDPSSDSIVRVEMRRLRSALDTYYSGDGNNEKIRIWVPVGTYVPEFLANPAGQGLQNSTGSQSPIPHRKESHGDRSSVPLIHIADCVNNAYERWDTSFCSGLTDELIFGLNRFEEFDVALGAADRSGNADFVLITMLCRDQARCRLYAKLVRANSQRCIWAKAYDLALSADSFINIQLQISRSILTEIAEPFGKLHQCALERSYGKKVEALNAYECLLQTQRYYASASAESCAHALSAARRSTELDPGFALGWAALSDMHCERYRMVYGGLQASEEALEIAKTCARQALLIDPHSAAGNLALSSARFAAGEVDDGILHGERALEHSPANRLISSRYGQCRAYSGDWDTGAEMVMQAMDDKPPVFDYQLYVLAEAAHYNGDYERSLEVMEQVAPRDIYFQSVMYAINHAKLGHKNRAAEHVANLRRLEPDLTLGKARKIISRDVSAPFVDQCIDGLRCAGMAA